MKKQKKVSVKKAKTKIKKNRGGVGALYVIAVLALMSVLGYMLVGQSLPSQNQANPNAPQVIIQTPIPTPGQNNLQLYTFNGATTTPAPTNTPLNAPASCSFTDYDTEPEILIGSDPPPNQSATANSQIKLWVTDEGAPRISPNEVVNLSTGAVETRGDTGILDSGTDGNGNYSLEPTLYIYPESTENFDCNAANTTATCTPHYPDFVKGQFNPTTNIVRGGAGTVVTGAPIDSYTGFTNGPGGGTAGLLPYTAEYIWNVSNLDLADGTYDAQYVIHDGDTNIGISCITISIEP